MINTLKKLIDKVEDETALRQIRNYADNVLQNVKKQKELMNKTEIENKYKGKYLLMYGSYASMIHRETNMNDLKIIHVLDIDFKGNGFFRCHAKVLHFKFGDEYKSISHISSDWDSAYISITDDEQYDINENEISEVIDKDEAEKIIDKYKENYLNLMKNCNI